MPKRSSDLPELPNLYSKILGGKITKKPQKGLTPARRAALVLKFSKGRCFECGKKFDYSGLDVHHIKERSKGGSNKLTNLTILCAGCHRALKFGYIDRKNLKPIMKPKAKKNRQRKRKQKKKPSSIFDIPKIKPSDIV